SRLLFRPSTAQPEDLHPQPAENGIRQDAEDRAQVVLVGDLRVREPDEDLVGAEGVEWSQSGHPRLLRGLQGEGRAPWRWGAAARMRRRPVAAARNGSHAPATAAETAGEVATRVVVVVGVGVVIVGPVGIGVIIRIRVAVVEVVITGVVAGVVIAVGASVRL